MSQEPPGLADALASVESWAEAKTLLALAAAPEGLPAEELAAKVGLPVGALLPTIERLLERGLLQRRAGDAAELVDLAPALRAATAPEASPAPAPEQAAASPAGRQPRGAVPEPPSTPASRPVPSRQIAGALRQRYVELFGVQPNLPWLMRQRRQAADLGLDFDALLREVHFQRPEGNPQGYLEALLRRKAGARPRQQRPPPP